MARLVRTKVLLQIHNRAMLVQLPMLTSRHRNLSLLLTLSSLSWNLHAVVVAESPDRHASKHGQDRHRGFQLTQREERQQGASDQYEKRWDSHREDVNAPFTPPAGVVHVSRNVHGAFLLNAHRHEELHGDDVCHKHVASDDERAGDDESLLDPPRWEVRIGHKREDAERKSGEQCGYRGDFLVAHLQVLLPISILEEVMLPRLHRTPALATPVLWRLLAVVAYQWDVLSRPIRSNRIRRMVRI
mmetsp:Transcript_67994/g.109564  ORF Transcript_67994/g.109564 Transcript_67994/m.109564 type:complete len:244 (+) Transcript_67994:306-1037(+)